ncbi:porphobilinogen synthase [Lachnoanaerobaculum saburreum]|uniref:Delta-aminolevulinic acid dehydratase n=1 Tax=Lachnoanaerobaculum saburreum DSM 3986 TaxID=887325 RepID=E6LJU1_9FIRM|nr:porphobilinogen synthase [Lachnoanaerobaculum saburreum]EFU77882.1 porphobilinogen synthase [Lachnoanaerobaculum saburreum DSM 3986]RKW44891.1 MAG: porphobilinogen synthase [Lachnospiraceae bacterium]
MFRTRRLRANSNIRNMVRETRISKDSLIYPMFFEEGENIFEEIESMPGQYRMSIDRCDNVIKELLESGVKSVILFGIPGHKDESGSEAYHDHGIVQEAIRYIKKNYPEVYIIGDVCMCEYTSHGHCGILKGNDIDNDSTIKYLAKIALSQVEAGADMVAPSDMMDGRVSEIRKLLDANGYKNIPIMSYSAKYASAFYGPFRVAADSAPAFGDRKTYQMDVHNIREAIKEVYDDVAEGADIVMVKPAMSFLDVVAKVKEITDIPVAAYSVSGEYAMVKSAAKNGFIDEEKIMCEMAVSAFRAGADIYITYYAKELAKCIDKGVIG